VEKYTYGAGTERLVSEDSIGKRTYYARGAGTSVLAEYVQPSGGAIVYSKQYVYLSGRLLAALTPSGTAEQIEWYHSDRLGVRLIATSSTVAPKQQVVLPYGTTLASETTGSINYSFTSYDRSTATKLDYAVNRFYSSQIGRFTQPDPAARFAVLAGRSQSMNLYAYAWGDPINQFDPLGLMMTEYCDSVTDEDGNVTINCGYADIDDFSTTIDVVGQPPDWVTISPPSSPASVVGGGTGSGGGGGSGQDTPSQKQKKKCWNATFGVAVAWLPPMFGMSGIGVSGGSALGFSWGGSLGDSRAFLQFQNNTMVTFGAHASVGVAGGYAPGAIPGGINTTMTPHAELDLAYGVSGSFAVDRLENGDWGFAGYWDKLPLGRLGTGMGAGIGFGANTTTTLASPSFNELTGGATNAVCQ